MKKFILIFSIFFSILHPASSQTEEEGIIEDDLFMQPEDTIFQPHYGNSAVLDSILELTLNSNNPEKSSSLTTISPTTFNIPIKVWLYRNDDGSNPALSLNQVESLINSVNSDYLNANTGIQFYLKCSIEYVNSTQYNSIDNDSEFDQLLSIRRDPKALNWHLVRNTTLPIAGRARFPWSGNNMSFACFFNGSLSDGMRKTTSHEIGHCLGLQHLHNTRGANGWNGSAGNCYQESVSRSKKQGVFCTSKVGKKKCDVNGDLLCDTQAAPNKKANGSNSIGTEIMNLDNSSGCNYVGGGKDNWNDSWTPQTRNFMAYVEFRTCRTEFTAHQTGVMHSNIITWMCEQAPFYFYPYSAYKGWYNLESIALSGSVNFGEAESYHIPNKIIAPPVNNTYEVQNGGDLSIRARNEIELNPGFESKTGSVFYADVNPDYSCATMYDDNGYTITTSAKSGKSGKAVNNNLSNVDFMSCLNILGRAYNRVAEGTNFIEDDEPIESEEGINFNEQEHRLTTISSNHNAINIYPNPSQNVFNIEFLNNDTEKELVVYSIDGKLIFNKKTTDFKEKIDLNEYPNGIYLLKIISTDQIESFRLIKND